MQLPPGCFLVADLNVRGELRAKAEYRYDLLVRIPGAADLIGQLSGALWRSPEAFETRLGGNAAGTGAGGGLSLRWRSSSDTAGIATVRDADGGLVSLSLLACGLSPEQDTLTLKAFQQHLLQELRDTGYEPAFALMDLAERPLSATINFQPPADPVDQHLAALADRCFAASYFRFHGLA